MNSIKLFILFLLLLLTSGYTKLGPDFTKPQETRLPASWDSNLSKSDATVATWWKIFKDPLLNELIDKMYA